VTILKDAQVTLVGLGLMGGSLAMRLKRDGTCRQVVTLVRRDEAAHEAEELGVVDWATTEPGPALADADLVIFATPVRILMRQLERLKPLFKPGAIITDLGSTKRQIMSVFGGLGPGLYPIGSHPMCGKEIAGLSAAEPGLYENATWVVSPLAGTPPGVIDLIEQLARSVGARPLQLEADRHDRLVAAISHLPYLLSSALVLAAQTVAGEDERVWQVAASGFKDTSRLAGSNVEMMMDILLTNQDAVGLMVEQLRRQLDVLTAAIDDGNEADLRLLLERARTQRRLLYI
jgi:prephenate dehydrogenase